MKHQHGDNTKQRISLTNQIATGTIVSAVVATSGKVMNKIIKSPVLVFGLGIVAGYVVYKYRKEIIAGTNKAYDASKDFVLQQKENLEDLVAETKEE
jgi:hypothetical protein